MVYLPNQYSTSVVEFISIFALTNLDNNDLACMTH